jgi:dinuclear metal center YbgI/SA1388 family protein
MSLLPTVEDVAAALAAVTDPSGTPDWDPAGLQLGDPTTPVETVGVCHEVTDQVVARLEHRPVDLLVTYHPLLFTPGTSLLAGRSAGGRAYRLITAGVALLVTHTDFDATQGGTADSLAALFALRHVRPFGADLDSGLPAIGRYGQFDGTLAAIDAIVSDQFGAAGLRITGDRDDEVESVAVVPGSGSAFIQEAAEVATVLVTGDVSHHRAVAARDLGLSIVDPGHVATERPGMAALVGLVSRAAGVEIADMTDIDPRTWS